MTVRNYQHTETVGPYKVTDATGMAPQCTKCGEVELTLKALAGYQRRAAAIAIRDAKMVDGAVIKYARKALGLRQKDLAELLGCAPETLSRIETGGAGEMTRTSQLALVAILEGVERYGGDVDEYVRHEKGRPSSATAFEVPMPMVRTG